MRTTLTPARSTRSAISAAIAVVDADDGGLAAGDQPFLDVGIMLHRAVAVEMIGRQVEQDAGRRIERRRQIDLVGRALDT